MNNNRLSGAVCACILGFFTTLANAALIDNGGGLIYDQDLDITWLADANYAGENKTWYLAVSWAESLDIGGAQDWRLPTADTCTNVTSPCSAEFNHLFYDELGGTEGTPMTGNIDLFSDIQGVYWTTEERDATSAWIFYFGNAGLAGTRDWAFKTGSVSVWAVHDGNIFAPIPPALLLFGSGLLGLMGISGKRRQRR